MLSTQENEQVECVIFPGNVCASHEPGGKAAALEALHTANIPVPAWFVVPPTAFQASLASEQRQRFAAACAACDPVTITAIIAGIRFGPRLQQEIEQAVDRLCPMGEYVAVRSSAVDEDSSGRSFAGQLESFLFVSPTQVTEKIIAVWRSGFSERVLAYRRQHGLGIVLQPPAVLVQRMVDSEVSGVAFSANPVTGQRGIAVVSALYGLGTSLVSGECDADTYLLDRQGGIHSRVVAQKTCAQRHVCGNVIAKVPVPPALVGQPALTDEQIRAVAELARRCECHTGCPQDIEWAFAGGELFLLQARPVTSLARLADPDGHYALWDNSNIAESYNGVTTPLTFSFARSAYEQVYRQMCRVLGVPEKVIQHHDDTFRHMIGLINGRVYYNLLNWYRLLALMPGFTTNRKFMEQMMGVKEGLPESVVASLNYSTWSERMRDRWRLLRTLIALLASYCHLPHAMRRFYQRVDLALHSETFALDQLRADELVLAYHSLERQLIASWDVPLINDLFAMLFYGILRMLTVKWCADKNGSLQNDLLTGEGGIVSAEPASRIREMANRAVQHPLLVESLCQDPLSEIQQVISKLPPFASAYQEYLDKFADRCLEELKLESATLRDDPLPLLRSIGYLARRLQAGEVASPYEASAVRCQAEQRVAFLLRQYPVRRLFFGWVLKQARMRVRDRENLRFERTRVFGRVRGIFSESGKRLHALERLEDPRDIFYLEVEEVLGFVTGTATTNDLKGLVSIRKSEFARYKTLPAPADRFETHGIVNHAQKFAAEAHLEHDGGASHQGTGCCPGLVRGPVRVITEPQGAVIHAGEILVARRTDPGWIMLFPAAAGVLVEHGSLLSHSAIVAREMSIPTIVGLRGATDWLCDGEWIEMDGSTGLVRKLNNIGEERTHGTADEE